MKEELKKMRDAEIDYRCAEKNKVNFIYVSEGFKTPYVWDLDKKEDYSPCVNFEQAFELMKLNDISLYSPVTMGLDNEWLASRFYSNNCGEFVEAKNKNPLRAICEVFLRMK